MQILENFSWWIYFSNFKIFSNLIQKFNFKFSHVVLCWKNFLDKSHFISCQVIWLSLGRKLAKLISTFYPIVVLKIHKVFNRVKTNMKHNSMLFSRQSRRISLKIVVLKLVRKMMEMPCLILFQFNKSKRNAAEKIFFYLGRLLIKNWIKFP